MSKQLTRLRQIVSELQSNPQLKINDLAEAFGVSSMTIRRDLAYLANNQIAELVPGGGVRINANTNFFGNTDTRYSLDTAEPMNREQKMRIGERAVQLVEQDLRFLILKINMESMLLAKQELLRPLTTKTLILGS